MNGQTQGIFTEHPVDTRCCVGCRYRSQLRRLVRTHGDHVLLWTKDRTKQITSERKIPAHLMNTDKKILNKISANQI